MVVLAENFELQLQKSTILIENGPLFVKKSAFLNFFWSKIKFYENILKCPFYESFKIIKFRGWVWNLIYANESALGLTPNNFQLWFHLRHFLFFSCILQIILFWLIWVVALTTSMEGSILFCGSPRLIFLHFNRRG